jgi:hypothetical protein
MSSEDLDREIRAADPIAKPTLAALDLDGGEAELGRAIVAGAELAPEGASSDGASRRRRSALVLLAGAMAVAGAAAVFLLAGGASSGAPAPAYGAELVRFAESTPLLLLEGPGWRVQDVYEAAHGRYQPAGSRGEGSMEFVTGRPIPYESIRITGSEKTGWRESGMFPPAVRQRKVELRWFHGSLGESLKTAHGAPHPHGQGWTRLPVLGATADVDTRAEFYVNQGGPGNRQMTALWSEDGYVLELRAAVPDLAAFEERLAWLNRVDSQSWLDAMPAKVVKAADHDAAVREMLNGIPVPDGFEASQIPDEGLTTNRYQVGASVTGIVSCLWFRQWGEARRTGDGRAEVEAERAMATSRHWPILHEMAKEGAYPETVWELAAEMPSGFREYAGHRWRLLPQAEALGCARWGIPVLPRKQRLQRERSQR